MRPSCFLYFREIWNKQSHMPGSHSAQRHYNSYNLCPCARPAVAQHMWASAGQGQSSSFPKQWKSDSCVQIYNSVSARMPLTKSKKKKCREHSNIKSARVTALTGSVPRKRSSRSFQHTSGIEPMSPDSLLHALTTKPLVRIDCSKKQYMTRHFFPTVLLY